MSNDFYFGGLPRCPGGDYRLVEVQLKAYLQKNFGLVFDVRCPVRKRGTRPAFAFVTFGSSEAVEKMLAALEGRDRLLRVTLPYARSRNPVTVFVRYRKSSMLSEFQSKSAAEPVSKLTETTITSADSCDFYPEIECSYLMDLLVAEMPKLLYDLCVLLTKETNQRIEWSRLERIQGFEKKSTRLELQSHLLSSQYASVITTIMDSGSQIQLLLLAPKLFESRDYFESLSVN